MQLELGDIIKIFSSQLEDYHEQVFVITFLNKERIIVQNIISNKIHELPIKDNVLLNKLIENIHLLKRHEKQGFVQQNNMTVNMWIDIHGVYNNDIPFSLTGKITNIDQDMIEVLIHSLEEEIIIYIDFAYQGISPNSNIKTINIRDKPIEDVNESKEVSSDTTGEIQSETQNIDKIIFHEDFLETIQVKEIKQSHHHAYSLDTQLNDMIEDILANNSNPSRQLLHEISILTERYKHLHNQYISKTKMSDKNDPHWSINVITNKPMLFLEEDEYTDENIHNADVRKHLYDLETDLNNQYTTNSYAERYQRLIEIIQKFYQINDNESHENTETVKSTMECIQSNSQETPNDIQSYSVCAQRVPFGLIRNITTSSFKKVMVLPDDTVHMDSVVYLPEGLALNGIAKIKSTNILEKALINDVVLSDYNVNKSKIYNAIYVNAETDNKIFDKLFTKMLHFKYDSEAMTPTEFKSKISPANNSIIMHLAKKMSSKNLSFFSVLRYMHKFSLDKDDVDMKTRELIDELTDMRLLELKKELIEIKNNNANTESDSSPSRSNFFEIYNDYIKHYIDTDDLSTSEILSNMMKLDNIDLFTSLVLLKKNDFLDFTRFDTKVSEYIDLKDGQISNNKCSKYYLSKQYSTLNQLELDNNKDIYFDTEFDKTNYKMFDEETLQDREKCINELTTKYKVEEKEAIYEYESMKNKQREVRDGDFALLYTEGKFIMFIRKKKQWEQTNKFSGMTGKEIFCNIQSDCFTIPTNVCSTLKDKQTANSVQDAKDSVSDFDKDIVKKKTVFKEIMMRTNEQNIIKLRLNTKHIENNAFKQSRMLYNIGTTYIPSEVEESPYSDIFQSVLNIKDVGLKYTYIIKFCANFTRDANILVKDESQYWKYCVKTNLKLVPLFIYKLAISYHISKTYAQELSNICKNQGVLSEDGDKFIDEHSGYIIKDIEYNDAYQPNYNPVNVAVSPQTNVYSSITDISKDYKHYIVNVIDAMCNFMIIKLTDIQKEYIMRNVVNDFNKFFGSRPIEEKKKQTVHSHYIMYFTLSYLAIEILTSVPNIRTNDQFPGCVKSFTGWPVTDKSDISGLLYIACVAYKLKNPNLPWRTLRKPVKGVSPSIEVVSSTIQEFLDKIITRVSVQKKIIKKIHYNQKQETVVEKVVPESNKNFLPPQKPFKIEFTITKGLNGLSRSSLQIKSFYYTISLFKKIQDLVKSSVNESDLVNEPLQDSINEPNSFFKNKGIQEDLKELKMISKMMKNKKVSIVYYKNKNFDLHFPNVLYEFMKNKNIINAYMLSIIDDHEYSIREMLSGLPEVIPREVSAFESMLQQYGIVITKEIFENIYTMVNSKTLFDSSTLFQRQLDIKTEFGNTVSENSENTYISKLFEMLYNEKEDVAKNTMFEEIKENMEAISEYVNLHGEQKNSDKKKFKITMQKLIDSTMNISNFWEPIRKTDDEVNIWYTKAKSLSDIESETTNNATKSIRNVIKNLTHTLPEMIKNRLLDLGSRFENVSCPDHWDISDIHKNDITRIIKHFYHFLEKYSKCPQKIISELDNYTKMVKSFPKICDILKRHFDTNQNNETLYMSTLFVLFEAIKSLIDITVDLEDKEISICMANIVYDVFAVYFFSDTFKQSNISNDDVFASVKRVKESEKNTILKKLEGMNDEERDVDNEYKKYSIGSWSSGKFRTYDKTEYDQGQVSNIYREDEFMSGLLGEIYVQGDEDFEEAFDLSDIPEDDIDPTSDE